MKRITICLMLCVMLFGCDKNESVDIIDFCNRYNSLSLTSKMTDEMIMREENGAYLIFIEERDRVLLKVICDNNNRVSAFSVTGTERNNVKSVAEKAVTASGKNSFEWYESDGFYTAVCE